MGFFDNLNFNSLRDWIFKKSPADDQNLDALADDASSLSAPAILERLAEQRQRWESTQVRLGFIGEAGVGKSSLINAILGQRSAAEGVVAVNHSPEGEEYQHNQVILVDLPGCGAPDRRRETYIADLRLLEPGRYDGFVLVSGDRLKQDDVWLFEELHQKAQKPLFLVRTKFDNAIKVCIETAAREEIEQHFRKFLPLAADHRIYLISAHHPQQFDLPQFLQDLCDCLSEIKRRRLLTVIPAYSEKLLRKKREACEQTVLLYAGLAAANGLNPIPGLNFAVDLGLVQKMTYQVIDAFGLRKEQLEARSKLVISDAALDFMLRVSTPILARLAEGGALVMMRQAGELAAEQGGKWIMRYGARYAPLVGQLVAAGIGFAATFYYGCMLLDDCESALRQIIQFCDEGPAR